MRNRCRLSRQHFTDYATKRPAYDYDYDWEIAIETKVRQAVERDSASAMVHADELRAALVENGIITGGA